MATTLLESMRNYLIAQSLVRRPRDAGPLPPLWLERKGGVPAPGQTSDLRPEEVGETMVLGAYKTTGVPPKPFEGFIRTDSVTIWVRVKNSYDAHVFEKDLRNALNDKRGWSMDGFEINQTQLFRDLQPTEIERDQGFTFNTEYLFDIWQPGV